MYLSSETLPVLKKVTLSLFKKQQITQDSHPVLIITAFFFPPSNHQQEP